ncbi:MAG: hypothetical protein ACP5IA_06605 [Sediminispirochaetaceae bacterium]
MTNDQIKELLQNIRPCDVDFSIVQSGKKSKRVNGLYKPETREIILHNRNFTSDNLLIYTAIHEYAHHIHFCSDTPPRSSRAHTRQFRNIFHTMLNQAEEQGIYRGVFELDPRFAELTERIRSTFIEPHGSLMKEFGRALLEAEELCEEIGVRFEDYISRVLSVDRLEAQHIMRVSRSDLPAGIGYTNMKTLARIRDDEMRQEALEKLQSGYTQDMLREQVLVKKKDSRPEDPMETLTREKQRILKTIDTLKGRLEEIEKKMADL